MPIDMTPTADAAGTVGDDAQAGAGERQQQGQQGQQGQQADAPALKPNEARLSDGRVIAMRRSTLDDGEEVGLLLSKMGYDMANLPPATLGLHNSLYAITHIDGRAVMPPRDADEMRGFRKTFAQADLNTLGQLYLTVQGIGGTKRDDFR